MYRRSSSSCVLLSSLLLALVYANPGTAAATSLQDQLAAAPELPLEDFSPALLGIYRKVMTIEAEVVTYSAKYGLDVSLARAVCMYESGGNGDLTSSAGAKGYFQVMPATFRLMHVQTNIEAGIKYLGSLVRQFNREDYALAAYNGGPGRVARGRAMPLESLQYVMGVGTYRAVLKAYEPLIRKYAEQLNTTTVRTGDDWWTLAERLGLPVAQLRLHNPFLAARPLRPGYMVVYPPEPREDLFDGADRSRYRMRLGDNYLKVGFALGVSANRLREANQLWHLQPSVPGTMLTIPVDPSTRFVEYTVRGNEALTQVARRWNTDPWQIVRDNYLWDEVIEEGTVLRIAQQPAPAPAPAVRLHRVRRGDTLTAIARLYHTTARAIAAANGLGRSTLLKVGQRLRIP